MSRYRLLRTTAERAKPHLLPVVEVDLSRAPDGVLVPTDRLGTLAGAQASRPPVADRAGRVATSWTYPARTSPDS